MLKRIVLFISFLSFFFAIYTSSALAQEPVSIQKEEFYRAKVVEISSQGEIIIDSVSNPFQEVKVTLLEGPEKGHEIVISHGRDTNITKNQLVKVNDTVVIVKFAGQNGEPFYQIADKYRLNSMIPVLIFFFLAVILLSGLKGVGSIAGMIFSLLVILKYIVPQILSGANPLTVSIFGSLVIMIVTIYLAHGFSAKTSVAVLSTFLTLVGIGLISALLIHIGNLTGLGSDEAFSLRFGTVTANIDFRGLLLGGIIIGALGVLDDITTSLSASIFELAKHNPKLDFSALFASGISIGREHIASLVNTLVLAYAGSSLPIFLMIILNVNNYPLWAVLNDGFIIEEFVRTIAGSLGLVAAAPLTALLAAFYISFESYAARRRPTRVA